MSAAIDTVFIINMNGAFFGVALDLERAKDACERVHRQAYSDLGWDEMSALEWIDTDDYSYSTSSNRVFAIWESKLL